MDALSLLTSRKSNKKLTAPAPNSAQLKLMLQAGLRAPDHGKLQPYRFIVIEKEGLNKFAQLLKEAAVELNLGEEGLKKAENLAQRAPMVIAVIAELNAHIAKVPEWEQMVTAGCATYAIQLAANAQGFDNVWISGKWVESEVLRQSFQCQANDKIVALLMIGSSEEDKIEREKREVEIEDFVQYF